MSHPIREAIESIEKWYKDRQILIPTEVQLQIDTIRANIPKPVRAWLSIEKDGFGPAIHVHQDTVKLEAIFGSEAMDTPVTIESVDGPLGVCGSTYGSLWSSKSSIRFDSADVTLLTVLHELVHVKQRQRGFFYRLKMKWWNKTKKHEHERPHEIEAEQRAAELAARW